MVLLAGIIVDQQQGMKFAVDIARGMEYLHSLEQLIPRLYLKSTHIMVSTRSDTRLGISQMLSISWQPTGYSCLAKYLPEKTANIFTMPLLVSPWNDNLASASDWLKQISHVAWPIRRTPHIWVAMRHQYMEFLRLFLTRHFAEKPVVVSWNVSCFLRLTK